MAWLDDRIRDHPKIRRTSAPAFKWWAFALTYCSEYGTGGELVEAVKVLKVPARYVDELVAVGLWDREPDGSLWVHDWQARNERRDRTVDERRAADRERQRAHRARVKASRDCHSDSHSDSHSDTGRDLSRDSHSEPLRARTPTSAGYHNHNHDQPTAPVTPDDDAAAADELRSALTESGWSPAQVAAGLRDPTRALAAFHVAANAGARSPGAYAWRAFTTNDDPGNRAANGPGRARASTREEAVERRWRIVSGDGWRLPADELEFQLAEAGAEGDELIGLLEQAAELRRGAGG